MILLLRYFSIFWWITILLCCFLFQGSEEFLNAEVTVGLTPLPNSPIATSSGVLGSLQCTKNSDESYAVCASNSNTAIKYNLQPFSFAAKGPNLGTVMQSCDLFESSSQSTSRAVCVKGYISGANGTVYFHRVSDMVNITNVIIGKTGNYPHVIVDIPNQVAYVHNANNLPVIYKITNVSSSSPNVAGNLSSFGSGDVYPAAMLIVDGFLYIHFVINPARLARINISTFTWNQTVNFTIGEQYGQYDNLANDDNFIYDLTSTNGILVRCTYKNNNFARFDNLSTGYSQTSSLAISPDLTTLIATSVANGVLQMVSISSFSKLGNPVTISSSFGRPIITSWCNVYTFSQATSNVYAFALNLSSCRTLTKSNSRHVSTTVSTTNSETETDSASLVSFSPSSSSAQSATRSPSFSTSMDATESISPSKSKSKLANPSNKSQEDSLTLSYPETASMKISETSTDVDRKRQASHTRTMAKERSATLNVVVSQIAVVAPPAASATASIAAAAGGAVGGDVASPTQAARALSLAAIATACANDVVYVPSPPPDEQLPWPQGSLIPQLQISLPNDDPKDSWRKHFRGAILANFVVFPLIILCIVVPMMYQLRFTKLQHALSAKYLFSTKSNELEERAPDLIADARLYGVILFLFGLGLESATCALTTLLASPRATSDSLGIDIFLCLLAITIIISGLVVLLKIEIGANEKLECVRSEIMFRSDDKKMSESQRSKVAFLLGSLCWTYRGSLDSEEKIEAGKMYFLRNRNLFASNQGSHEENEQNNNQNEITLATKANNKINEESNSIARKISVFASLVDCSFTVIAGLIRGLTTSGVLPCGTAIILLVISQGIVLLWALLIRPSLYPITKMLNILMSFLMFGAALATLWKYAEASTFAVSVALTLSFLGMFISLTRLFVRKVFDIIVYPKREKIVEEMKQEIRDVQSASLAVPLLDENDNSTTAIIAPSVAVDDNDFRDVELLATAPHSPQQGPSEIEINIPTVVDDDDFDIDLSMLMENIDNDVTTMGDVVGNLEKDGGVQGNQTSQTVNAFVIGELGDDDVFAELSNNKKKICNDDNDDDQLDDDDETIRLKKNKSTSDALVGSKDSYEAETNEQKLKRLLEELEDDKDLNEVLERRRVDERRRKQTMTKEQQEESLRKIQQSLGRKQ